MDRAENTRITIAERIGLAAMPLAVSSRAWSPADHPGCGRPRATV